jgi:pyruvate kinase
MGHALLPGITPAVRDSGRDLEQLHARLTDLRQQLVRWDRRLAPQTDALPDTARRSARNLIHYLAFRREDLRPLQEALASCGLSSLGRTESHVLASLEAVIQLLDRLSTRAHTGGDPVDPPVASKVDGRRLLETRANALFGPPPEGRTVRIMVTAPDAAATDYGLARDLLVSGMNCLRINCAHGDPALWSAMIANLHRAEKEVGVRCRVLMDLAGPRARTGRLASGPAVLKIHPQRDPLGWVIRPAELWLTREETPTEPPVPVGAVLPFPAAFLQNVQVGDLLQFRDSRDAKRAMRVVAQEEGGFRAHLSETAYVTSGTSVRHTAVRDGVERRRSRTRVGPLPRIQQRIGLEVGDRLILTRSQEPGVLAGSGPDGRRDVPARIPCFPPQVLDDLAPGEPIWFDEGKIGGIIEAVSPEGATVSITSTASLGASLAQDKAINLPQTNLSLPSLTEHDLENLPFVAAHADLVGYSFVRSAADVEELYRRLDELNAQSIGVVLKIESARAFEQFPSIALAALQREHVGVMIARGDLAVECGFTRLAEIQEELLWLCEAAHLPIIWATQVLENLAKHGRPSRAEVTDAAAAVRAECVMLNKGPHITEAVRALDSIMVRMRGHLDKKQSLLRHLQVADHFLAGLPETGTVPAEAAGTPAVGDDRKVIDMIPK